MKEIVKQDTYFVGDETGIFLDQEVAVVPIKKISKDGKLYWKCYCVEDKGTIVYSLPEGLYTKEEINEMKKLWI